MRFNCLVLLNIFTIKVPNIPSVLFQNTKDFYWTILGSGSGIKGGFGEKVIKKSPQI